MSKTEEIRRDMVRTARIKTARKDPIIDSYIKELEDKAARLDELLAAQISEEPAKAAKGSKS